MEHAAAAEAERLRRVARAPLNGAAELSRSGTITLIRTNKVAIILQVGILTELVEDKLASLRESRSNEEIDHYEKLKLQLRALRGMTFRVDSGEAQQEVVENTAKTFGDFVWKWFEKDYERVCGNAYDAMLFAACVGLCSLVR
jgi:hypothetical protein